MDIKTKIKSALQEAEIYRTQGLIAEARQKYESAASLINSIDHLKNKDNLLNAITLKINAIDKTQDKVEKGPNSPELSSKAQDLIKNLFTFTDHKDSDDAVLEGAIALAKFGQFDRALKEFESLLQKDSVRISAAKNIIRCHLAVSSAEDAVSQYRQWHASDLFPAKQLETVRLYLDDLLQKKGVQADLPVAATSGIADTTDVGPEGSGQEEIEEEFLDITSIGITFETGPRKGKMVEFDVNFQSGNMLSLIVSKKDKELIEDLNGGMKLEDIQFYSPIAIFNGSGVVSSKTEIKSGPKQGDFCLDIRITNT